MNFFLIIVRPFVKWSASAVVGFICYPKNNAKNFLFIQGYITFMTFLVSRMAYASYIPLFLFSFGAILQVPCAMSRPSASFLHRVRA